MKIRLIVRRSLAIVLLSRKKISLLVVQSAKTFLLICSRIGAEFLETKQSSTNNAIVLFF